MVLNTLALINAGSVLFIRNSILQTMITKLFCRCFPRIGISLNKKLPASDNTITNKRGTKICDIHSKPSDPLDAKGKKKTIFERIKEQRLIIPDEELIADSSLHMYQMPKEICTNAKKVFSKHNATEVREWGKELDLLYRKVWCREKPSFLANIPNFSNDIEFHGRIKKNKIPIEINEDEIENKIKTKKKDSFDQNQVFILNYERSHAVAYLKNRLPRTYFVMRKILNEIKIRIPFFAPTSSLDFGAGLGSAVWASIDEYPAITQAIAVEPNSNMRALGKFMTSNLKTEILWVEALSMIPRIENNDGM